MPRRTLGVRHKHNCSVCNEEILPTFLQRDKNNSLIMNSKFCCLIEVVMGIAHISDPAYKLKVNNLIVLPNLTTWQAHVSISFCLQLHNVRLQ